MLDLKKHSVGVVVIVSCILCSVISSISERCPDNLKAGCVNVAGILNLILCVVVVLKVFGIDI